MASARLPTTPITRSRSGIADIVWRKRGTAIVMPAWHQGARSSTPIHLSSARQCEVRSDANAATTQLIELYRDVRFPVIVDVRGSAFLAAAI